MQPKSMGWLMSFDNHCRLISQMLDHRGPTRRTKLLEQTYDLKVCDPAYKGGACVCVCVCGSNNSKGESLFLNLFGLSDLRIPMTGPNGRFVFRFLKDFGS
jgi:hypothetical protein